MERRQSGHGTNVGRDRNRSKDAQIRGSLGCGAQSRRARSGDRRRSHGFEGAGRQRLSCRSGSFDPWWQGSACAMYGFREIRGSRRPVVGPNQSGRIPSTVSRPTSASSADSSSGGWASSICTRAANRGGIRKPGGDPRLLGLTMAWLLDRTRPTTQSCANRRFSVSEEIARNLRAFRGFKCGTCGLCRRPRSR